MLHMSGSEIVKLWAPSPHDRCAAVSLIGGKSDWNNLKHQRTGDDCANACANNALCNYAVWEGANLQTCHGFTSCSLMVSDASKEYVIYRIKKTLRKQKENIQKVRMYDQMHEPKMNDTLLLHVGILSAPGNKKKVCERAAMK